jgi:hypothetical protein
MDPASLGLNSLHAVVGVILMWVSYRLFDCLTPEVNFPEVNRPGFAGNSFL